MANKPIAVATRCSAHHVGTALAGTTAGVTYRYSHVMRTAAKDLQLVFANFYPTVTSESSGANSITIAASIEYGGLLQRLSFNGERVKTLEQGGIALTDPVWRDIPEGATFHTRIWVSVPVDGNTFPQGLALIGSNGEGKSTGDQTLTTGALGASSESGYGPSAIIGVPKDPTVKAFALIGDSMVGDQNGDGWPVLAVQDRYGYSLLSRPGSDVSTMQQNSGNAYRLRLMKYFTHAIVTYGSNDWNLPTDYPTQEGRIKDLWRALREMDLFVYQATTLPRTTSTDTWATVNNQTVYTGNSFADKRATFNARLRSGVFDALGVNTLDAAAVMETNGVWLPGRTGDGIHPVLSARQAIAASINL